MRRYIVRKLTTHRSSPRIYLDIRSLADAGFIPGKPYSRTLDVARKSLTLTVEPDGPFVVSRKNKGTELLPVIDINSSKDLAVFEGQETVRVVITDSAIHILPIASEVKRAERLARLSRNLEAGTITTAGISFGGGVLDHAAHTGLSDAGISAELAMANEIDEQLLDHAQEKNDIWAKSTIGIAAPMQELVQDPSAMACLPQVDLFCGGIPCSGASRAGKSKRGLTMMEDHPLVGHLVASALMVINRINPAVVVIENVPGYSSSASAQILRHHLRDSGYVVQETTLAASEFGCLENRVRWFLVATTRGIEMELDDLAPSVRAVKRIGSILDPIEPDADQWRTFDYLKKKVVRDASKGNGFGMQIVNPDSTSCPTLRRGLSKQGSTDPLLAHPTKPDLLRPFTVAEHARIKEVPEHLVDGLCKTAGHSLLGQSIAYAPVKALFKRIGECLLHWKQDASDVVARTSPVPRLLHAVG